MATDPSGSRAVLKRLVERARRDATLQAVFSRNPRAAVERAWFLSGAERAACVDHLERTTPPETWLSPRKALALDELYYGAAKKLRYHARLDQMFGNILARAPRKAVERGLLPQREWRSVRSSSLRRHPRRSPGASTCRSLSSSSGRAVAWAVGARTARRRLRLGPRARERA